MIKTIKCVRAALLEWMMLEMIVIKKTTNIFHSMSILHNLERLTNLESKTFRFATLGKAILITANPKKKERIMALKPNPVNWFEIPAKDLSRATNFYQNIFGVELQLNEMASTKMAWFPMAQNGPGAGGSLIKGDGYKPSTSGSLVYFSVDDIESVLKKVNAEGGKTLEPKTSIGEHGFIALFEDTEGNRVGIHSK